MKRLGHFAAATLLVILITACSAEPPEQVITWAIGQKHSSVEMNVIKMKSHTITNHYTREIDGEKIYFYDYTFIGVSKIFSGEQSVSGSFAVVKRGDNWYMYR